jgi:hypothetical protein
MTISRLRTSKWLLQKQYQIQYRKIIYRQKKGDPWEFYISEILVVSKGRKIVNQKEVKEKSQKSMMESQLRALQEGKKGQFRQMLLRK